MNSSNTIFARGLSSQPSSSTNLPAISRRAFLHGALAGLAACPALAATIARGAAPSAAAEIRLGSCRVDLRQALRAGLDGAEVSAGDPTDQLRIADPAVQRRYLDEMAETGLPISSFMMGLLNSNPLATDPRAPAWLEQSIDAARALRVHVILVAFFGKGDLRENGQLKRAEVDQAVQRVRAAAPRARDAGVILALENTLSARQNAEILDRINHESVQLYYDVGNSTRNGYNVPEEIRFLKERIACIHFKDGSSYLGQGEIQFPPIARAIDQIGYRGWIVLETANPSKDAVADARRNADYIRELFGMGRRA
ncbi:MAG TPA: sugar phosphate isomerase/epimerase family protein [Candidatus Paceibacterota bacterium]|nr:sugar phosphate isomerase/epimerase [Verrucomicrobiota bacterium]HOX02221.1 sugar phosphate isomerase/epimerase family protein [Verrucomicrobiota bacterium]HRZ45038.1 sugar phosphate isomerase/epimerase family protein [Candidatus Paceibacterota bacterium]HRZ92665.1 sugar phosphate isomerase/epimerase family protein [Candidatus Paceibacterota bacterium]